MIDETTLDGLLALSKLKLGAEEREEIGRQIDDIIGYFEVLAAYDTSRVDVDLGDAMEAGSLRGDEPVCHYDRSLIDAFAVEREEGHFVVPRILEQDFDE